ncbi:hypothetical protein A2U01_0030552, partial [Trifolium medium]|nr:hypothetical protein [Trifolium medium]
TGICGACCCACDELPGPDLDFAPFVLLGFFVGFSTGGNSAGCFFLPMAIWLRISWVVDEGVVVKFSWLFEGKWVERTNNLRLGFVILVVLGDCRRWGLFEGFEKISGRLKKMGSKEEEETRWLGFK